MNGKTSKEVKEPRPKSTRLSSLIWILILWLFVYLISCLGGTGASRMFGSVSKIFGLFPASVLLLFAASTSSQIFQAMLRWMALVVFLSSFFLLIVLDAKHVDQDVGTLITQSIHWGLTLVALAVVLIRVVSGNGRAK